MPSTHTEKHTHITGQGNVNFLCVSIIILRVFSCEWQKTKAWWCCWSENTFCRCDQKKQQILWVVGESIGRILVRYCCCLFFLFVSFTRGAPRSMAPNGRKWLIHTHQSPSKSQSVSTDRPASKRAKLDSEDFELIWFADRREREREKEKDAVRSRNCLSKWLCK